MIVARTSIVPVIVGSFGTRATRASRCVPRISSIEVRVNSQLHTGACSPKVSTKTSLRFPEDATSTEASNTSPAPIFTERGRSIARSDQLRRQRPRDRRRRNGAVVPGHAHGQPRLAEMSPVTGQERGAEEHDVEMPRASLVSEECP
jgi:hypothetical protein